MLLSLITNAAHAAPRILAAESVYGQVAQTISGAPVPSILKNPAQDPHDFEPTAATARAAATADIVILNGAGYDSWMEKLLAAAPAEHRAVISAARLMGAGQGANPHLWYDPATMPRMAQALAQALAAQDPAQAANYQANLQNFLGETARLQARIGALRARFAHTPVTATEPVFGLMAAALGLDMHDTKFQIATMNDVEPTTSDVAAIESGLRHRRVRILFTNAQVASPAAARLKSIAAAAHIPTVGVTETLPPGTTYIAWMNAELDDLEHALTQPQ